MKDPPYERKPMSSILIKILLVLAVVATLGLLAGFILKSDWFNS